MVKEFKKYDDDPYKWFARFEGEHSVTGRKYGVDVGWERFLAPEIFFNPEIASSDFLTPLPEVVDNVIQSSPMDVRRGLYKVRTVPPSETSAWTALLSSASQNIVLSGGSTMFKNFSQRLKRDLKGIVDSRVAASELASGGHMRVRISSSSSSSVRSGS